MVSRGVSKMTEFSDVLIGTSSSHCAGRLLLVFLRISLQRTVFSAYSGTVCYLARAGVLVIPPPRIAARRLLPWSARGAEVEVPIPSTSAAQIGDE
jgi:hypothetical protein